MIFAPRAKGLLIQASAQRIPLADNSVHCWISSPPYWGLRAYGTHPEVWGGDDRCVHEWGDTQRSAKANSIPGPNGCIKNDAFHQGREELKTAGTFCRKCGAWRGELGSEPTPELFVANIMVVMREVRRVLRADGTAWLNLGDSYATGAGSGRAMGGKVFGKQNELIDEGAYPVCQPNRMPQIGLKPKDQCLIPHRVALALQADGWWVRDTIIWHKPNPMPSSVTDRTTTAHEYVFLLTKSERYFYDADAIREPITSTGGASFGKKSKVPAGLETGKGAHGNAHRQGLEPVPQYRALDDPSQRNNPMGRNKRSVWTISTQSYHGAHFATFPVRLVEPCIKAGTSEKGCCPACAAPWKRIVERLDPIPHDGESDTAYEKGSTANRLSMLRQAARARGEEYVAKRITTAWVPTCTCNAGDPIPCTVLDTFNGSGTTVATAVGLGRRGIGIDLNGEYMPLARERIAAAYVGRKIARPRTAKSEPSLFHDLSHPTKETKTKAPACAEAD